MAGTTPTRAEIDAALGREPEAKPEPRTRAESIMERTAPLDDRMHQLADKHRDYAGGESHEQAYARVLSAPGAYEGYKAAKAATLRKAGITNPASGGVY